MSQAFDIDRLHSTYLKLTQNSAEDRFNSWTALLAQSLALPDKLKLTKVNDFFNNRIRFAEDQELWGQSDYWATPMETLAKGAGDCEDFTIAKYYSLLQLGIPVDQLRLTYVHARIGGASSSIVQAHMVLTYYPGPDDEPLVLDNLINSILPASRRPDLQPVFSFNGKQIYSAGSQSVSASTSRLSRWQDLLRRAHNEGFD